MHKSYIEDELDIIASGEEGFTYDYNQIRAETEVSDDSDANLLIKIISIIGGIMITATFFGFLSLSGIFYQRWSILIAGFVSIISSLVIARKVPSIIFQASGFALFLVGIFLINMGLTDYYISSNLVTLILMLMSLVSFRLQNSYIISWASLMVFFICIFLLILLNDLQATFHLYNAILLILFFLLCYKEADILILRNDFSRKYFPMRSALITAVCVGFSLNHMGNLFGMERNLFSYSSITPILLSYYLLHLIFQSTFQFEIRIKVLLYAILTLLMLPMTISPGMAMGFCVLLLSFHYGFRLGIGLGMLTFIYFIGQFYYDLHYTLLTKSLILIASGILLLPVNYIFLRIGSINSEK